MKSDPCSVAEWALQMVESHVDYSQVDTLEVWYKYVNFESEESLVPLTW